MSLGWRALPVTVVLFCGVGIAADALPELQLRETKLELTAVLDYQEGSLSGNVRFEIENVSSQPAVAVPLNLNRLMKLTGAADGQGRPLELEQGVVTFVDAPMTQINHATVRLPTPLAPGDRISLRVDYSGYLVGYTETGSLYIKDRIDEEFTILRADAYAFPVVGVPSWRANRLAGSRNFEFEIRISVPADLTVASGGALIRHHVDDGVATFVYRSTGPVPFLNIPIARYDLLEKDGIRVYHFPDHAEGAKTVLERTLGGIDLLTKWFGPLGKPIQLSIMEIPDGWGSQASLTGGIIQTSGVFEDPSSLQELYHELSHLWNASDTDRPSPRWNEGLASFLQRRMAEKLDGWDGMDESVEASAIRLVDRLGRRSESPPVPFARYGEERMTDLSYGTGMLMFHVLHHLVGREQFNTIVGGYYQRYRKQGGSLAQFVEFADTVTDKNLSIFFEDWLYTTAWQDHLSQYGSVASLTQHYRSGPRQ